MENWFPGFHGSWGTVETFIKQDDSSQFYFLAICCKGRLQKEKNSEPGFLAKFRAEGLIKKWIKPLKWWQSQKGGCQNWVDLSSQFFAFLARATLLYK